MEVKNIIFCTYFDKNYLIKGLAMHSSLMRYNPDCMLYILCMDDYTKIIIEKLKLKNTHLISLSDFEDSQLLKAKQNRNIIEYYWTCTPSLPLYVLKKNKSEYCIYIDADFMFYSSVDPIIDELNNKSIYIVEHRYPKNQKERNETSGRFNVGILVFKNDKEGIECLEKWRKQCIDWCYWREEDGKMGDQLYLNDWPKLYKNIVISANLGVNVAPWNINQYSITIKNHSIYLNSDKLICFHFHQFKIYGVNSFSLAIGYKLKQEIKTFIYSPYLNEINIQIRRVKNIIPDFNHFDSRFEVFLFLLKSTFPRISSKLKSLFN